jgi:hypothetical protein
MKTYLGVDPFRISDRLFRISDRLLPPLLRNPPLMLLRAEDRYRGTSLIRNAPPPLGPPYGLEHRAIAAAKF